MSLSELTPRQRRTVAVLAVLVIAVLAILTGFIITSTKLLQSAHPPTTIPTTWAPTPEPTVERTPTALAAEDDLLPQVRTARLFEQIAYQVETLRELPPRGEVPLSFLDEQEIASLLQESYTVRSPANQWAPLVVLGLLPEADVEIRARAVVGVYLPEQRQLFVGSNLQNSTPDDQALLARSYAYALQDQHFDLSSIDARAPTTDARLAASSLMEGDAILLMALYRYQDLGSADWPHLEAMVEAETPSYGTVFDQSDAWRQMELFPVTAGRMLVQMLFETGGWSAVNAAYADLPRTTEQVLHPERYLQERDMPSSVVVPDIASRLGAGWALRLQDTLGEFVAGLYLRDALSEEVAQQAIAGWDGDTLAVWEHEDGQRVLVWRTHWDTIGDALEFEQALIGLIQQRHTPAWPLEPPPGSSGRWWQTSAGVFRTEQLARHVTLIQAPSAGMAQAVAEAIP